MSGVDDIDDVARTPHGKRRRWGSSRSHQQRFVRRNSFDLSISSSGTTESMTSSSRAPAHGSLGTLPRGASLTSVNDPTYPPNPASRQHGGAPTVGHLPRRHHCSELSLCDSVYCVRHAFDRAKGDEGKSGGQVTRAVLQNGGEAGAPPAKVFWRGTSALPWPQKVFRKVRLAVSTSVDLLVPSHAYMKKIRGYILVKYGGHGFQHLFKAGKARRLTWLAIVSYFLFLMVSYTLESVSSYRKFPKSTTVQVVDEDETEFPAVTICNYNALSKSRIKEAMRRDPSSLRRKLREVVVMDERFEAMLFSGKKAAATFGRVAICASGRQNWPTPSTLVGNKDDDHPWPYQAEEDQWNDMLDEMRTASRRRNPTSFRPAHHRRAQHHRHQYNASPHSNAHLVVKPCELVRILGLDKTGFNFTGVSAGIAESKSRLGAYGSGVQDGGLPQPSQAFHCSADGMDELLGINDTVLAEICGKAFYDHTTHRPCLITYLKSGGDPSKVVCYTINRMCDGAPDCGHEDDSDEKVYCDSATGRPLCHHVEHMKQCNDGTCYDSSWRCNGFEACPDGSDEIGCPDITYDDSCECFVRCDTDGDGERDASCVPMADEFMDSDTLNLERVLWRSKSRNFQTLVDRALAPTPEEIRLFGIRGKDFIVSCSFDGKVCSYKDFYKWQNQDYGNCFTFNSPLLANETGKPDKIRMTKKYGYKNGLKLNLNIEPHDYLSPITPVKGVRMLVHSRYRVPFPAVLGYDLSPLTKTSIALRKNLIHRAPSPYGRCSRLNEDAFRMRFHYNYSYHACMEICQEVAIRKICGCSKRLNQVFRVQDPPPCLHTNARHRTCIDETVTLFNQMDPEVRNVAGAGCRRCDPACNEVRFDPHISGAVPNKEAMFAFSKETKEFVSGDFCDGTGVSKKLRESGTVFAHVYFETLLQENTVEFPSFMFLQFISSVGGTWGLFAGFSLFTFIEWFELGLNLLRTWFTGIKRDLHSAATAGAQKRGGTTQQQREGTG